MTIEFKAKQYGYKVVDQYGDKLGEIHTDGMAPLFEATRQCSPKTLSEMQQIAFFMDQLQWRKEL